MADNFAREVQAFTDKTTEKVTLAVQKISLELFQRVILRSPVDTGRFRGNWQVSIGAVASGTLELDDKTGAATVSKAQAAALGVEAGQVITIVNNLPYGPRLENGWSSQAPGGMVALTVQDFQQIAASVGIEVVSL